MPVPTPVRLALLAVASATLAGCDGALTLTQRFEGEWVGRAETAAERVVREWPGGAAEGDPAVAEAVASAPVTDLESAPNAQVAMRLDAGGAAELTLNGARPLVGTWTVTPSEGRRSWLEVTVEDPASGEPVRRRFEVEFLPTGTGFVLREYGSDRRFGRLVFTRPGEAG